MDRETLFHYVERYMVEDIRARLKSNIIDRLVKEFEPIVEEELEKIQITAGANLEPLLSFEEQVHLYVNSKKVR